MLLWTRLKSLHRLFEIISTYSQVTDVYNAQFHFHPNKEVCIRSPLEKFTGRNGQEFMTTQPQTLKKLAEGCAEVRKLRDLFDKG